MTDHVVVASPSLEALVEADLEARAAARAGAERVAG